MAMMMIVMMVMLMIVILVMVMIVIRMVLIMGQISVSSMLSCTSASPFLPLSYHL